MFDDVFNREIFLVNKHLLNEIGIVVRKPLISKYSLNIHLISEDLWGQVSQFPINACLQYYFIHI